MAFSIAASVVASRMVFSIIRVTVVASEKNVNEIKRERTKNKRGTKIKVEKKVNRVWEFD